MILLAISDLTWGTCFRFLLAISMLAALIFQRLGAKEAVRGRNKISHKKIRVKNYKPDVSFYTEGDVLHASFYQVEMGVVMLFLGYLGLLGMILLMVWLQLVKKCLFKWEMLFTCSLFFVMFLSLAILGTQYLFRKKETLVIDSTGIRGMVREIHPELGYWKRWRITPMQSFDCRWDQVVAAQFERVSVGMYGEYVLSLYGKDSDTVPLACVDLLFFGEPRQLVDVVNYYYAIGNHDTTGEYVLVRPLLNDIVFTF